MSSDNGYILRRNAAGRYVLQGYSASAEDYPEVLQGEEVGFATLVEAMEDYNAGSDFENMEEGCWFPKYYSEYGLTVQIKERVPEKPSVKVIPDIEIWRVQQQYIDWSNQGIFREEFFVTEEIANQEASGWSGYGIGIDITIKKIVVKGNAQ